MQPAAKAADATKTAARGRRPPILIELLMK
jgi:hypothetical protein